MVIGDKLGYPRELWTKVREWSEVTMFEGRPDAQRRVVPERTTMQTGWTGAIADFARETMKVIAAQRAPSHSDDLISLWCKSEIDGRPWTDQEVISETILVLDGGAETTRTVIGSMICELALRPDQRQILIDNPAVLGRDRCRGVHPLGDADPQHAPHGHRGSRIPRPADPRG